MHSHPSYHQGCLIKRGGGGRGDRTQAQLGKEKGNKSGAHKAYVQMVPKFAATLVPNRPWGHP